MIEPDELRHAYLGWIRRAAFTLAIPIACIALMQFVSGTEYWVGAAPSGAGARYLFYAVAAASIMMGRTARGLAPSRAPLAPADLTSLSWRLLVFASAPVLIGAVLALMTRALFDFYALLALSLVGFGMLFPRWEQWCDWASPPADSAAVST